MVPIRAKSMLPADECARPAAHSRIAAWKTSVPTTRRGVRRKTMISAEADQRAGADARSGRARSRRTRRGATAATLCARSSGPASRSRSIAARRNSARHEHRRRRSTSSATATRGQQRRRRTSCAERVSSSEHARRRSTPGTEPNASHFDTPRSTVPLAQVPPAADGLGDRAVGEVGADRDRRLDAETRISSGVMSEPPPIPVEPDEDPDAEAEEDDERVHAVLSDDVQPALGLVAARPSGPRGRRPAGCTARSRSTRSRWSWSGW